MMRFANPWILTLLVLVPPAVYLAALLDSRKESSVRFSDAGLLMGLKASVRTVLSGKLVYLRAVSLTLFIMAAARPQSVTEETQIYVEGIDIVLAVDVSSSMRAMDFEVRGRRVDRLEVVRDVVLEFIEKRSNDRIGLVAFAALAYTVCPLTLDHEWLEKNLGRVQIGMIEDGTAVGSAISASLNRLKDRETKEKIIILLTDGRNNAGKISPMVAAEAARAMGVRVYTIGAGTKGLAPYPVKDMFGQTVLRPVEIEIDDALLTRIADTTGGAYFRATDTRSLMHIYDEIDKLEKTPIEESGYNIYHELFPMLLLPGIGILLGEIFLANTLLRRVP